MAAIPAGRGAPAGEVLAATADAVRRAPGDADPEARESAERTVERAAEFVGRLVGPNIGVGAQLRVTVNRAETARRNAAGYARIADGGEIVVASGGDTSTMVHELMHVAESPERASAPGIGRGVRRDDGRRFPDRVEPLRLGRGGFCLAA